jgi:hypothetical protein
MQQSHSCDLEGRCKLLEPLELQVAESRLVMA